MYKYELIENGYFIEGNGTRIMQTNVAPFSFPYPGETIEKSAQNHINALIAEQQEQQNKVSEIEQLKVQNAELTLATLDLAETVSRQDAQLQEQSEALLDLANTLAEVMNNG